MTLRKLSISKNFSHQEVRRSYGFFMQCCPIVFVLIQAHLQFLYYLHYFQNFAKTETIGSCQKAKKYHWIKMKFFHSFSQFPADLVTFNEEIFDRKLYFCAVYIRTYYRAMNITVGIYIKLICLPFCQQHEVHDTLFLFEVANYKLIDPCVINASIIRLI